MNLASAPQSVLTDLEDGWIEIRIIYFLCSIKPLDYEFILESQTLATVFAAIRAPHIFIHDRHSNVLREFRFSSSRGV